MTKLILSTLLAQNLRTAKNASDPKTAKRAAWSAIRSAHGIPSYVKLGAEVDPNAAGYGSVWVKDSNPRTFLHVDTQGRYTSSLVDGATPPPATVSAPTPVATASKFMVAGGSANDTTWHVVTKQELLALLREGAPSGDEAGPLPDDFPTNLGTDSVVLDGSSGCLYYRA